MNAQVGSKRPALTLIVTDRPQLSAPRKGAAHEATKNGDVTDPFWQSVFSLVKHLKSEYNRITSERPCAGPTVEVSLPPNCTFVQIEKAFELIRAEGWDILPSMMHGSQRIYLRNYQC